MPLAGNALAQDATPREATISVSGEGQSAIAPDMAILSFSVVKQAETAAAALTENSKALAEVLKRKSLLLELGVAAPASSLELRAAFHAVRLLFDGFKQVQVWRFNLQLGEEVHDAEAARLLHLLVIAFDRVLNGHRVEHEALDVMLH